MHENVVDKRPSELRVFESGNHARAEGLPVNNAHKKKSKPWVERHKASEFLSVEKMI